MSMGWFGVDLDGTLATYDHWRGVHHIGEPIPKMVERIRTWLENGYEVRIMTARVSTGTPDEIAAMDQTIKKWLVEECKLPALRTTCSKDFEMLELWDDRAVQVIPNTGERADGLKTN